MKGKNKDLQGLAQKYIDLNVYGDVDKIVQEREEYYKLYKDEIKRSNDLKVAMESQKRLLQNTTKFNQTGMIRPATSGKY